MSLDAKIKEMAQEKFQRMLEEAQLAVESVAGNYSLYAADVARLISMHKSKTTEQRVIKMLSDRIAQQMLASLEQTGDNNV